MGRNSESCCHGNSGDALDDVMNCKLHYKFLVVTVYSLGGFAPIRFFTK
jgi:hypothetical protein